MLLVGALSTAALAAPSTSLIAQAPLTLPGASGRFDCSAADPVNHRIFVTHPGCQGFVAIDTIAGTASEIDVAQELNGAVVDQKRGEVLFGGADRDLLIYDARTLKKKTAIILPGPGDAVALDSKTGMLYVDEDEGQQQWIVDPAASKVVGSVAIGGEGSMEYDPVADRIYQNVKSTDSIQVVDPDKNRVVAVWSTLPSKSPHGIAIDDKSGRLYCGGRNGELVAFDLASGKEVGAIALAASVSEVAIDPTAQRVYTAGGGYLSVIDVATSELKLVESIPIAAKARNVAVDASTGNVWIAYANGVNSFVQCFKPAAARKAPGRSY